MKKHHRRMYAAYLLDRADQYETESPCWIALADAAANVASGEAEKSWEHGELEDGALMARVRRLATIGGEHRPVDPRAGIDDAATPPTKGQTP